MNSVPVFVCGVTIALSISLIIIAGCASEQHNRSLIKVGLGETIITPDENVRMRGFARSQISTGVHDDLHSRSLVVEDANGTAAVLMTVSLCGMSEEYAKSIRDGITGKTGIPGDNIVISCTHTHAGPNVGSSHDTINKEEVDRSMASAGYRRFLVEQCIASAVQAWENRIPGKIGIASTTVFELGRNRRRLLYGGLHPDPEVAVIKVEDAQGNLMGVAFNYGCHPSGLDWRNTLLSEDWPCYAIQGIKKRFGDTIWTAYYQSAEGDINLGYLSELSAIGVDMPIRNYAYIEKKGMQMAQAVLDALTNIETSGDMDVSVAADRFDYPLRTEYPVAVKQAQREATDAEKKLAEMENIAEYQNTRHLDDARVELFQADQRLRIANRYFSGEKRPAFRSLEQQAIRIGNAVFVTFPGELFSEIGLAIKNQSQYDKTFVIGVTCGPGGYLPVAKEFIEGDYEVNGSAYSAETEQFCILSSLDIIRRIVK